jgi:hypothetical protein
MALADGQETPKLSVCRHRAGDGQDAGPVDLSRVDREYTKAAKAFRERMKVTEERTAVYRDQGHNAGVKACVRAERRDVTLRDPLPAKLCGRRLYFLSVPRGDRLPSGLPVPLEPEAVVFLLEYASLEDAGKLARRLNVGVTPATTALAQRLGLRCLASVVDVDGDGKRLTIQEIAP